MTACLALKFSTTITLIVTPTLTLNIVTESDVQFHWLSVHVCVRFQTTLVPQVLMAVAISGGSTT